MAATNRIAMYLKKDIFLLFIKLSIKKLYYIYIALWVQAFKTKASWVMVSKEKGLPSL